MIFGGFLIAVIAIYEGSLYLILDKDPYYFEVDRFIDSRGCWDGIEGAVKKIFEDKSVLRS